MALSDSLWHTAALEAVTSSLELSLFAGANVGALAFVQIQIELEQAVDESKAD